MCGSWYVERYLSVVPIRGRKATRDAMQAQMYKRKNYNKNGYVRVQKHAGAGYYKHQIEVIGYPNRIMICNVGSVVAVADQPMTVDVAAIENVLELLQDRVCCHVVQCKSPWWRMSVFAMVQVTLNVLRFGCRTVYHGGRCLSQCLEITIATEEVVHDAVHVRQGMDGHSIVIVIAIGIQVVDSLGGVTGTIGGRRFGIVGDDTQEKTLVVE